MASRVSNSCDEGVVTYAAATNGLQWVFARLTLQGDVVVLLGYSKIYELPTDCTTPDNVTRENTILSDEGTIRTILGLLCMWLQLPLTKAKGEAEPKEQKRWFDPTPLRFFEKQLTTAGSRKDEARATQTVTLHRILGLGA